MKPRYSEDMIPCSLVKVHRSFGDRLPPSSGSKSEPRKPLARTEKQVELFWILLTGVGSLLLQNTGELLSHMKTVPITVTTVGAYSKLQSRFKL
jgi:hypothetical protein